MIQYECFTCETLTGGERLFLMHDTMHALYKSTVDIDIDTSVVLAIEW